MHTRHSRAACRRPVRPQCAPASSTPRRAHPPPPATPAQRELEAAGKSATSNDPSPTPLPTWAADAGIEAPSVRVAFFDGVRGLQATAPIPADAPVVTLPVEAALLVRPGAGCPLVETYATADYWKRAPWFAKMTLLLVRARRAAEGTETDPSIPPVHAAYAADLPPPGGDAIDTPVCWSPSEVATLHYPPLIADVAAQRTAWDAGYASYKKDVPATTVTQAEWEWGLTCVRSRAFSGPYAGPPLKARAKLAVALIAAAAASVFIGHAPLDAVLNGALAAALFQVLYDVSLSSKIKWHAMAPVVDLANHSGSITSDMQYAYFRDAFVLTLGGDVGTGDQVYISYGPQGNDSLLQWYGFVEAPNPHDSYRLAWTPSGKSGGDITTVLTRSGVDDAAVATIREAMGPTTTAAAALTALLAAVDAEAAAWPGSGDADGATAADPASPRRAATAAAFRREKRAVLAAARRAVGKAVTKAERL